MESSKLRPTMLGIAGIGLLCAAFLPAMKINIISLLGSIPMEFSLREATNGMLNTGRGWAVLLAIAGVTIVIATLLKYDDVDKKKSRNRIICGTVLALLFPINLLSVFDSVVAEANVEADGLALVDISLSSGMIIPCIALIVVTGLAWYGASQESSQTITLPPTPTYTSPEPSNTRQFTAVYESPHYIDRS